MVRRPIGFGQHKLELDLGVRTKMPTYGEIGKAISDLVTTRDGEWCGMPVALPGLGLVLEDRHPWKHRIEEVQRIIDSDRPPAPEPDADALGWHVVNSWHGRTPNGITGEVVVMRHDDGRRRHGILSDLPDRNKMLFGPLESFDAWDLDTELVAMDALADLLTERMYKCYILTGGFLETSKRSGLTYFFRRCRPTIVMSGHGSRHEYFSHRDGDDYGKGEMRVLCCLCLHPLAYYANTFAGAMTPTDDIIAHVLLLRADEHMFWKRANQHAAHVPQSGL